MSLLHVARAERRRVRPVRPWLVLVVHLLVVIAVLSGCESSPPRLDIEDAGRPPGSIDGGGEEDGSPALALGRTPDLSSIFTLPFSGEDGGLPTRVSPPLCPQPGDPTFCADCYRWTDGGPDSLDRNTIGDEFGQVASGDFNGDGYEDLAVGAPGDVLDGSSPVGAVYVYLGSDHGFLPWRRTVPGENKRLFGRALVASDFDDDGLDDLAVTYETAEELGAVVVLRATPEGFEPLATVSGATASFGSSLAAMRWDSGDEIADLLILTEADTVEPGSLTAWNPATEAADDVPVLDDVAERERLGRAMVVLGESSVAIGAPEVDRVYLVPTQRAVDAASVEAIWIESSISSSGFGDTIRGQANWGEWGYEAELLVGSQAGTSLERVLLNSAHVDEPEVISSQLLSFGSAAPIRAVAVLHVDREEDRELFGAQDAASGVSPLRFFMTPFVDGEPYLEPDAQPTRVEADRVGSSSVVSDWNADGFDDLALGAPAPGSMVSAGQVFGYLGGYVPWDPEGTPDNHLDFEDSYFHVDQEIPVCDRCVALELPDGDPCPTVEDGVCIDGACEERTGCGDGYLEPGADPPREGCDDRGHVGDDACDDECVPTPFVIAAQSHGIFRPTADRSLALDGRGRGLVAVSREEADPGADATYTEVFARRYRRDGVEEGAPVRLASLPGPGWDAQPVVVGLEEGWAVAWRQPSGSELGTVVMQRVAVDGTLSPVERVSGDVETLAEDPAVTALSDGTVLIAWTDATNPTKPIVRYRWMDEVGDSEPRAISSDAGGEPAIVARDLTALLVWVDEPEFGERPSLRGVRFTRTSTVDATPLALADVASEPTVSANHTQFVLGWVARLPGAEGDPEGDIWARTIPGSGAVTSTPVRVSTHATSVSVRESAPSIVAHGDGWIVGWEEPAERLARIASGGGTTLPPEVASILAPALTNVMPRDLSLAAGARGMWIVWSAAYEPGSDARRASWGFLMPPE